MATVTLRVFLRAFLTAASCCYGQMECELEKKNIYIYVQLVIMNRILLSKNVVAALCAALVVHLSRRSRHRICLLYTSRCV